MPMVFRFTKLTAAGNDFICVDNRDGRYAALCTAERLPHLAQTLCRRGLGVGADGIILATALHGNPLADILAQFLEPDGSEAELCGNGTACFTVWALERAMAPGPELRILTPAGIARGQLNREAPGRVRVCIPNPHDWVKDRAVVAADRAWVVDTIVTGVPHAMVYVDNLETITMDVWGRALRWHAAFQPRGVNVNFVQILAPGHIAVRTFEFGVEAETLSCGTGSASAAIVTALKQEWDPAYRRGEEPVLVEARGGETLKVWFLCGNGADVTDVCVETRVRTLYEGELAAEFFALAGGGACP